MEPGGACHFHLVKAREGEDVLTLESLHQKTRTFNGTLGKLSVGWAVSQLPAGSSAVEMLEETTRAKLESFDYNSDADISDAFDEDLSVSDNEVFDDDISISDHEVDVFDDEICDDNILEDDEISDDSIPLEEDSVQLKASG